MYNIFKIFNYYKDGLRKSFVFKGRSTRTEFWLFILCNLILIAFVSFVSVYNLSNLPFRFYKVWHFAEILFCSFSCIPMYSIAVRRLHDSGKSGWILFGYCFLNYQSKISTNEIFDFLMLAFFIVLIVFLCLKSDVGKNKYDEKPVIYWGGTVNFSHNNLKITSFEETLIKFSEDFKGCINLSYNNFTTLKKCPKKVSHYFDCSHNKLATLEYCPQEVGEDFNCSYNQLINLKGSPKKIGAHFDCSGNKLETLEYCLEEIMGDFNCSSNRLTSLKDCPKKVGGNFICSYNQLTSLEHYPKEIKWGVNCSHNKLTSLESCPRKIKGFFDCSSNKLETLECCPEEINGNFICSSNNLTSLEGCPAEVGGSFDCRSNQLTSLKGCPKKVNGSFYCFGNQLTNLEGAPDVVRGGDFDCRWNQLTSLKGCPKEIHYLNCSENPDLTDISDLSLECEMIDIRNCPKIEIFPRKIFGQLRCSLTFRNPTKEVRQRIKKCPFYVATYEDDYSISIDPALIDE